MEKLLKQSSRPVDSVLNKQQTEISLEAAIPLGSWPRAPVTDCRILSIAGKNSGHNDLAAREFGLGGLRKKIAAKPIAIENSHWFSSAPDKN